MAKSLSSPSPNKYNMTTEEVITMFPSRKEEKQSSSKCLVYALVVLVAILFIWLVFASIVLRVVDPQIQLKSARLMHNTKNHSFSSTSSLNVTMIARVSLTNPNLFGRFYYGNSRVSVLYGASIVGAWELEGARLEGRETKEIDFMVHMRFSTKLLVIMRNLTNDTAHSDSAGMLKLRSYAKLSGTVHVLNMVNKKKTLGMACIMNLNLTSYSTQHFQC
ncbi:hypothetical protein AAZX31_11G020200 [Glycine max]|nr:late embryogenesis abundant protein At1g64065 [Glycine max]XP_028189381.1 late embryogenesis abundant protein At1g64065-like [Glycine soja]KAG4386296.1 hypothetical protein GLYMA_11G020500v4 [Glycine max]KAG4972900.1 hypothetical protein JHK87_029721 [Glycine soja]KAG4993091.1 hypothetical protein JHK86_029918 [Glycine max]KAG5144512.1 hypothetical protein JHK84_030055 [Glycine max]KHN35052.1 hypothetical protein glysoja_004818 [Glycine soja]|eukprot:XP_006591523.1 late embryogenesis abundant protein At1g64065 [Glycine max]